MRAEWRSVWRGSGGLCVTVGGTKERHWWCAGRVDLEQEVEMSSMASLTLCNTLLLKLQEPHFCLVPTLVKAVVQFLATSVVPLVESQTLQSVVWVLWGQSTVTMAEMLQ